MSELIASSTRDFLFITLNQYNDETTLKRAEVVMRRDQPFFEGGNSFVAAESFRISSAPSDGGGIYYTKVPYTYYMGTEKDDTDVPDSAAADQLANWVRTCHFNRDQLVGTRCYVVRNADPNANPPLPALVDIDLRLGVRTDPGLWVVPVPQTVPPDNGPFSTRTEINIRQSLESYFSGIGLSQNSYLKLNAVVGGHTYYIVGKPQVNPAHTLYGPGCGVSDMYVPHVYLTWDDSYLPKLTTAPYQADLKFYIPAQMVQDALKFMDRNQFQRVIQKFVARGVFMENQWYDSGAGAGVVEEVALGPWFNVLGPSAVGMIPETRTDIVYDTGPDKGKLKVPIVAADDNWWYTYKPVRAWITRSAAGRPTKQTQAFNLGLVDPAPFSWSGDNLEMSLRVELNTNITSDPNLLAKVTKHNMENATFAILLNPDQEKFQIRSHVRLEVAYFSNPTSAGIIPDGPLNENGWAELFIHKPKVTTSTVGGEPVITHQATKYNIQRRPNQTQTPLPVYSPNEFFYGFNRPPQDGSRLPWQLGTAVNGGFQVIWDTSHNEVGDGSSYTSFTISVALCDALDLQTFMTYERSDHRLEGNRQVIATWVSLEQPGGMFNSDWLTNTFDDHTSYTDPHTFAPIAPSHLETVLSTWLDYQVPENKVKYLTPITANPQTQYDGSNGDNLPYKYYNLRDVQEQGFDKASTYTQKINPILMLDSDDVPYYYYPNLPVHATLGNNARVSVESFSTYSGINLVSPNLPFQPQLGPQTDQRILCSLRLPFTYGTENAGNGQVTATSFAYYGDLLWTSDSSRTYLKLTTDASLYDLTIQARLLKRDGTMEIMKLPYKGEFNVKLRFVQTQ